LSHFEYISVAASLVYALILAKLLGAIPAVLKPDRRYWVHSCWLGSLLFVTVGSWWEIWSHREAVWSPGSFLALLFIPSIIYLRASVLLGDEPREVLSWREHYYSSRRPFFLLQLVGAANYVAVPWLISGATRPGGSLIGIVASAVIAILGATSAAPRLHELIAVVSLVAFSAALFGPSLEL
jgi:hypothetical protein